MKSARVMILAAIGLLVLGGCARVYRVEIQTEPPGAKVQLARWVGNDRRGLFPLSKPTPVEHTFDFGASSNVAFDLKIQKERYLDVDKHLTAELVQNLPVKEGKRVLKVPLERAPFQEVEKAEVVVDPTRGLLVEMRRVRAFEQDIEREGMPASKLVTLEEGMGIGGLTVSPDGGRIAFAVIQRGRDEHGDPVEFSSLRAVSTAGGGITQMTTGRWMDLDPSFSPDGTHLFFASDRLRNDHLDLFRINSLSKGGGIAVIHRVTEGWSFAPSQGPNGLIAFAYLPEYSARTGSSQVWTLGGKNQYPTQCHEGSQPQVSPDGQSIAYIGPDNKLWVIPVDAQTPVQLTTNPETAEREPAWSPDGRYVIYVSNEGKDDTGTPNNDIWMMRADGTDRRQLTTNGSDDVSPIVDPRGRWIYFVSNRGYKWGIWRFAWPSDTE